MKVAVVGATGLVGSKMLEILEERNFPVTELIPVASSRSLGKTIQWKGKDWTIVDVPAATHVGAVVVIVGTAGVTSITKLLNDADATDEQLPLLAATS